VEILRGIALSQAHRSDADAEDRLKCWEVQPPWRFLAMAQLAFDRSHPEQVKHSARSQRLT
jgi:hypothetical protein